jgi:hypothetical protein
MMNRSPLSNLKSETIIPRLLFTRCLLILSEAIAF